MGRDRLVQEALRQTQKEAVCDGFSDDDAVTVFVGGHSLGSILAQMVAHEHPTMYNGVIVHKGYVMNKYRHNDQALPVPISGSRDGLNRLSYGAI